MVNIKALNRELLPNYVVDREIRYYRQYYKTKEFEKAISQFEQLLQDKDTFNRIKIPNFKFQPVLKPMQIHFEVEYIDGYLLSEPGILTEERLDIIYEDLICKKNSCFFDINPYNIIIDDKEKVGQHACGNHMYWIDLEGYGTGNFEDRLKAFEEKILSKYHKKDEYRSKLCL